MRHPAYPKSVCGVVYQQNSDPGVPVQLRLRRLALSPARRSRRGARRATIAARRARRLCRALGRFGDPLSRRLCRAALGADAVQGRQARRAYLLSLAGRLGPARRLHRPLHRRAVAIPPRFARRQPCALNAVGEAVADRRSGAGRRARRSRARRTMSAACSTRRRAGRSTSRCPAKPDRRARAIAATAAVAPAAIAAAEPIASAPALASR